MHDRYRFLTAVAQLQVPEFNVATRLNYTARIQFYGEELFLQHLPQWFVDRSSSRMQLWGIWEFPSRQRLTSSSFSSCQPSATCSTGPYCSFCLWMNNGMRNERHIIEVASYSLCRLAQWVISIHGGRPYITWWNSSSRTTGFNLRCQSHHCTYPTKCIIFEGKYLQCCLLIFTNIHVVLPLSYSSGHILELSAISFFVTSDIHCI